MRHIHLVLGLVLLAAACDDDNDDNDIINGNNNGNTNGAATLIDRVGRPGITTALIGTFEADTAARDTLKDRYNAVTTASSVEFIDEIASNLAVYDALDQTCGNQLLAGTVVDAQRYRPLATVLADDRLFVNSESGSCNTYLAVEADATGFATNTDCGGRTPLYDVIDITFSLLVAGDTSSVTDNVDSDDQGQGNTDVPFLADPLLTP